MVKVFYIHEKLPINVKLIVILIWKNYIFIIVNTIIKSIKNHYFFKIIVVLF